MNLQEFITASLTQVIDGVKEVQKQAKDKGAIIIPRAYEKHHDGVTRIKEYDSDDVVQMFEFDVALTVQETDNVKGGIGIFVGAIGVGTQAQSEGKNASVSRIKFSIPICLPFQR